METIEEGKPNKMQMALAYARDGWAVVPLHSTIGERCTCKRGESCGSRGKHPRTKHGVKDATKDPERIRQHWTKWPDANIGLATGTVSGRLVLDVDNKTDNRGDESVKAYEKVHGTLPKTLKSQTVSNGWHLIFQMPDITVKSDIDTETGLDLLANGRYFAAPPSTINGKTYQWVEQCEAAPCPPWVAALGQDVAAPQHTSSEDRIPGLIRELFPNGRESSGEWIACCPYHDDHNPSFEVKLETGVFYCFSCEKGGSFVELYAKVKNVSEEEARRIIRPIPAFVEELNRKHAVIVDFKGKCLVINEKPHPIHKWKDFSFASQADLKFRYQNRTERLGTRRVNLAEAWFRHPDRREYREVVFAPGLITPGYYNLWQGFAVVPKSGDCSLYLKHIHDIICRGNAELYHYVLSWMAQVVQRPSEKPGVALVLRGTEGVGKGTMCTPFGSLFGPHFMPATSERQLVGNFNAHYARAVVVFADEAFWAGSKASEGLLKALITEKTMRLEFKGKDAVDVENYIHLMIATNNDWAVPAGLQARRFCIIDVGDERMNDWNYFAAINNEMNNGGREALLHYLLNYGGLSVDELRKLPHTEALMETKLLSMSPAEEFWYEVLVRGTIDNCVDAWMPRIRRSALHDLYIEFAKNVGQSRRSSETVLGKTLKKLCPHVRDSNVGDLGKTERVWEVGELQRCREAFDRVMHWPNHDWGGPSDDQNELGLAAPAMRLSEPLAQSLPTEIEELNWEDFRPAADKPKEKEQTPEEKETVQPVQPQSPSPGRIICQPRKKRRRKSEQRRKKRPCNLRKSRKHRPEVSSSSRHKNLRKESRHLKKRRHCNLNNTKKGQS